MRRTLFIVPVLTLLLVSTMAAHAQTVVSEKMSLLDAIALSLKENVDLKSAAESRTSSISRLKIAELNTSYSLGSRVNLNHSPSASETSSLIYSRLTYTGNGGTEASADVSPLGGGGERGAVGLTVRQPLTAKRGALSDKGDQILSARSALRVSDYGLFQSRQSTVIGVIEAYYDAVLEREQVKVEESAVQLAVEVADATRKREAAGLMTGMEVSRADINVARTKNSLNLQRASAQGALDKLMISIGSGIGRTPELIDQIPETLPEMPTLEKAQATALADRTEIRGFDERISEQARDLSIRKDDFRPALDAVARFSSTNDSAGLISGSMFDQGSSLMGVELTLPLDQRVIRENRDISASSLQVLKEQRAFRLEGIAEQIRNAYRGYEAAKISLDIYSQNLSVAEKGIYLAQRLVEEGEGSNRDILDAQQALTEVQGGVLSAKANLYLACIRLKLAMGEDLTKMGTK